MLSIYDTFCKGKDAPARMLTCYIEEAHAKDEWHFPNSAVTLDFNAEIAVHRSIDERIAAAKLFKERTKTHCLEVVCDSMEGHLVQRYDAWPERLYVIVDGVVVYRGGVGPFDYRLDEVRQWLQERFNPQKQ
jgi:hypothetical protein